MPYVIEGSDVDGKLFYLYLLHTRVHSTPLFTHVPNSKGQRATRDQVSQSDARAIKGKRQVTMLHGHKKRSVIYYYYRQASR